MCLSMAVPEVVSVWFVEWHLVVLGFVGPVVLVVLVVLAVVVLVSWVVVDSGAALVWLLCGHWALCMGRVSAKWFRRCGLALWLGQCSVVGRGWRRA